MLAGLAQLPRDHAAAGARADDDDVGLDRQPAESGTIALTAARLVAAGPAARVPMRASSVDPGDEVGQRVCIISAVLRNASTPTCAPDPP